MVGAEYSGIFSLDCSQQYSQLYSQCGSSDVASGYDFRIATVYFAVLVVLFIQLFQWLATWNRQSNPATTNTTETTTETDRLSVQ